MERTRSRALLTTAFALALVAGACGENSDGKAASSTVPPSTAPKPLEVTGIDYAFTGVPATVPAGTVVSFKNTSAKEVHELVALRVKDGETRPVSALLQLPEAERDKAAEFSGVAIAFPNEAGFTPEGPVTLRQPGRYIFICNIPTGADPAAFREAAKNATGGPPPSVPGGPPHTEKGMVSELKVT